MTDPVFQRRRRNAILELERRGVAGGNGMPAGMRMILRFFPNQRPPYYGDRGKFFLQLAVMFGLMMTPFLWIFIAMDGRYSGWVALGLGLLSGVGFSALFVPFLGAVHRRMRLTQWEDLDADPTGEAPEGAEDYDDIETEHVMKASRMSSNIRRL